MQDEQQSKTPKWLSELQQRSWEPEILLSGIVLYGMFKVPGLLDDFLAYFKLNIFGNSNDVNNLISLFKMGIYWLITGLILHLICRGIWIGMVGLSYAFPNGINTSRLNYQGKFKEKVESTPSYEQIVIRLEKISSMLFSLSFMLFMSLIGGYLFFFVLVIFPFLSAVLLFDTGFSGPFYNGFQYYVMAVLSVGILGLIDFLTMGYLRKFRWFSKLFWPIHRAISILTLSRFYRPIYYGMVSHFNKWAFFILLTVFVFVSIFGAGSISSSTYPGDDFSRLELWGQSGGMTVYGGNYQDQYSMKPSIRAQIPSDVISSNVLRLFVVSNIELEDNMLEHMPLDSLKEAYPDTTTNALKLMIVSDFYRLKLDTTSVEQVEWFFHYNVETKQRGYLCYLDLSDYNEGPHKISITLPNARYSLTQIPFYLDLTNERPAREDKSVNEVESDFQPKPFGIRE